MKLFFGVVALCGLLAGPPAVAQDAANRLLGTAVAAAQTQRTVTVAADTRSVNVSAGESIRFVVGTTEFGWKFDGPGPRAIDLRSIAPAATVSTPVTVYLAASPGHRP